MSSRAPGQDRATVCIATSVHPDYDARVFRHAATVARAGYYVDLICPWEPGRYELPPGLRIVPFRRVSGRLTALRVAFRMLPLLVRRRYAVYHFHDINVLPLFALLRLVLRRPVVYDCHENYADEMLYRPYRIPAWSRPLLARFVLWFERSFAAVIRDVVIVVPHQLRTFPRGWFRPLLVRNFADVALAERRAASGVSPSGPGCISTASQYVNNGALLILDIARSVAARKPEVNFFVVDRYRTDLRLRERVLQESRAEPLKHRFHVLPNVPAPEVITHLARATIALALDLPTPSRVNALPVKLFEYMAAGLPIVASDLPNIREVIADAGCGLLVAPGDPEAFADAICRLVEDPNLAREMGARGLKAFRDRYNWETEAGKLLQLYETQVTGGGRYHGK